MLYNTVSTETLGIAFEPEQKFEAPDGTSIVFQQDYFDNYRSVYPTIGPFEDGEAAKRVLIVSVGGRKQLG